MKLTALRLPFAFIAILLIGFIAGRYTLSNKPAAELPSITSVKQYTCPMHSGIITDKAGNCPICGMDLVEKPNANKQHIHDDPSAIHISSQVQHNLGVRTGFVTIGDLHHTVETIGKITRIDPMSRKKVTPPVAGTIVYMAEKYDGDNVKSGELLFSISSDKLTKMQEKFQTAFQNGDHATATNMIPALRKAGLTPAQIANLQEGASPNISIDVFAPQDGYIFARRGNKGDKIPSGFTVFNMGGDYQIVEVTAEIFERDWGVVEEKQSATMTVRGLPGKIFKGEVTRVEPPVGYTTRSLEIRLKFKTNEKDMSQNTFARVTIAGRTLHNRMLVPLDAVIRTGNEDRVVVIRPGGIFQPLPVVVGEESDGMIEILSGLRLGGKIVTSGQFLIDSESNLASSFARMEQMAE